MSQQNLIHGISNFKEQARHGLVLDETQADVQEVKQAVLEGNAGNKAGVQEVKQAVLECNAGNAMTFGLTLHWYKYIEKIVWLQSSSFK